MRLYLGIGVLESLVLLSYPARRLPKWAMNDFGVAVFRIAFSFLFVVGVERDRL